MIKLTVEEENLLSIYKTGSKRELIESINKQFSTDAPQRRRTKIRKWVPASYACYETFSSSIRRF